MTRRRKSLELMQLLAPFTQGGICTAQDAREIVNSYVAGDESLIKDFILNPSMPMTYGPAAKALHDFLLQ